jgi:hypothetical protein
MSRTFSIYKSVDAENLWFGPHCFHVPFPAPERLSLFAKLTDLPGFQKWDVFSLFLFPKKLFVY